MLPALLKPFDRRPWLIFALVCLWKMGLLIFSTQPIPAGDAYFYDGAVVHALNGGLYANPSLSLVLPISGNEVFSAYPPLHQGALWVWMSIWGTTALSAMWFQFVLFLIYGLAVLAIFRAVNIPPLWVNLASLFFFGITFLDRPDTLAFACGMWALFGWVRGSGLKAGWRGNAWDWLAAALLILSIATSLHIGAIFMLWSGLLIVGLCWSRRTVFPLLPFGIACLIPVALIALVKLQYPHLWAGFQEHLAETPTLAGWNSPNPFGLLKGNLLKLARTAPALAAAAVIACAMLVSHPRAVLSALKSTTNLLLWSGLFVTGTIFAAALLLLMQNPVHWSAYLQPLLVAILPLALSGVFSESLRRRYALLCLAVIPIATARAIGMTTWGMLCSFDVNHARALDLVNRELNQTHPGSAVAVSSAFLYAADRHRDVRLFHADWLAPYRRKTNVVDCIVALRPTRMILTQFDYYRGCGTALTELKTRPELTGIRITNAARTRPPDAFNWAQRIVQHVSWAPVVVELDWKSRPAPN